VSQKYELFGLLNCMLEHGFIPVKANNFEEPSTGDLNGLDREVVAAIVLAVHDLASITFKDTSNGVLIRMMLVFGNEPGVLPADWGISPNDGTNTRFDDAVAMYSKEWSE